MVDIMTKPATLALVYAFLPLVAGCAKSQLADAEQRVRQTLRDPLSAQFQKMTKGKTEGAVCGEVNAKNSGSSVKSVGEFEGYY